MFCYRTGKGIEPVEQLVEKRPSEWRWW